MPDDLGVLLGSLDELFAALVLRFTGDDTRPTVHTLSGQARGVKPPGPPPPYDARSSTSLTFSPSAARLNGFWR